MKLSTAQLVIYYLAVVTNSPTWARIGRYALVHELNDILQDDNNTTAYFDEGMNFTTFFDGDNTAAAFDDANYTAFLDGLVETREHVIREKNAPTSSPTVATTSNTTTYTTMNSTTFFDWENTTAAFDDANSTSFLDGVIDTLEHMLGETNVPASSTIAATNPYTTKNSTVLMDAMNSTTFLDSFIDVLEHMLENDTNGTSFLVDDTNVTGLEDMNSTAMFEDVENSTKVFASLKEEMTELNDEINAMGHYIKEQMP